MSLYPLCGGNATGHWLGLHTSKAAIAIPNLLDARKGFGQRRSATNGAASPRGRQFRRVTARRRIAG